MALIIKEILKKDITRPIDGVIKAGDESHILQEVEEYVITREIDRELRKFIDHYKSSIEKKSAYPYNGVWISGYFGSGKSHLLKILSLVMGNRIIDSKPLKEIFLSKITDTLTRADFENILNVPSTSILFNIEQMADSARNRSNDPILFAFSRMFNRMRGYYDESGPLANFERDLDSEGALSPFKSFYKEKNRIPWEEARPKALLLGRRTFVQTFAAFRNLSTEEADQIIKNYEATYSLTVDSFCREVDKWLNAQPDKRHRINFFVDEVGQFIAADIRYMLSLQTIVETLGIQTGERAWVFVTSQEAINKIIGDKTQSQNTDFSKIIARFKFRIALSSADVREVIQHRLLEKNEKGTEELREFYHSERDSMRTVFGFREGARNVQYKDEEDFIYSYPFPAYQYDLLQEALKGLGEHNAFIGQHVSRGERSMLEMFQDVGKAYKDKQLFAFAPFDAMYDGIRSTLDTGLIMAINQAENHLSENSLAVRALKVLLLVKYVKDFRATFDNMKVLLIDSLDGASPDFDNHLRESLSMLEREMYLRRTGEIYEYLTNDEKDAEEEIRRIHIDNNQYRRYLSDYLFGEIIRSSKLRYAENSEDYSFQKAVDDESPRGQGDLVIRLITPWHPDAGDRQKILTKAWASKELSVIFPDDESIMEELEIYYKTESWLRTIDPNLPKYARIIADKRAHNADRSKKLRERVLALFSKTEFAVAGDEIQVNGGTAIDRIERAFQQLVQRSYPHLGMIKSHYTQESLRKILFESIESNSLNWEEEQTPSESEKEMQKWIQRKFDASEPITLASIKEEFSRGMYGWYEWAILCTVAKLFVRQEIELFRASEILERNEVFNVLNQNRGHETVSIRPSPKVTVQDMERLKNLHFNLFHTNNTEKTAKECGIKFKEALLKLKQDLDKAINFSPDFAFINNLKDASRTINALINKEWHYFLEHFDEFAPSLNNLIEGTIEPALAFLNGPNIETWKKIDAWLAENHDNLDEIAMPDAISAIRAYRDEPELYKTGNTRRAKELWNSLADKLKKLIEEERARAMENIRQAYSRLAKEPEWEKAPSEVRDSISAAFGNLEHSVSTLRSLGAIRDAGITKANREYTASLARVTPQTESAAKGRPTVFAAEEIRKVQFSKPVLTTEADVDAYTAALSRALKDLIAQGKQIRV